MIEKKKLSSWKEIATYLGIGVRTAQRWEEKLHLPVRRLNDSPGTFVYADKEEIDKWFEEKVKSGKLSRKSSSNKKYFFWGIIVIIVLVVVALLVLIPYWGNSSPSGFKIDGANLIFLNKAGKRIGSYFFNPTLDIREYIDDTRNIMDRSSLGFNIFFKDINKDRKIEVVFALQTKENLDERIYCFTENCELMWSFQAGKDVKYGDYSHSSSDFDLSKVKIVDLDNDGLSEIVMIVCHKIFFPSRVVVLDHQGKLKGEFWNSGHLACMEFVDLDDDGFKEIILGGLNNNYNTACIIVLDPRKIEGSSPQEVGTRYYSEELGPGSEKYYILIPPDEVGYHLSENHYEVISYIVLLETRKLLLETKHSSAIYEFDYKFNPDYLHLRDKFKAKLGKLRNEGKIKKDLEQFDRDEILSRIRYWDGEEWVNEATMTEYWRGKGRSE